MVFSEFIFNRVKKIFIIIITSFFNVTSQALLDGRADVNRAARDKRTPLYAAAAVGALYTVRLLLRYHAHVCASLSLF